MVQVNLLHHQTEKFLVSPFDIGSAFDYGTEPQRSVLDQVIELRVFEKALASVVFFQRWEMWTRP